ncbi:MAG: response regulator [Eubacteriales bacterium]|nr:response regulator [Eubacteriales bacterium]
MYTLLIADDEPLIRNGIRKMIDWESLGFSEILLAEDGQEALDMIRSQKVDLVLTDILMPFLDGLALSEILAKEYPQIHVVILTGHDDFEYARQSIDLGVKNYILKPVGAETLYKKMKKICETLHIQNEQKEYISSMRKQLRQSLPALRAQLLNRMVCSFHSNPAEYLERAKGLDIHLEKGPFLVAVIEMDKSGFPFPAEDGDLYLFAAQNIASECVGAQHYIFEDNRGAIVLLFCCTFLGEDFHDTVYQTLGVIQKAIYNTLKIETTCGVGSDAAVSEDLYESYSNARRAADCKFSLGTNSVYDIGDLDYLEKSFYYPIKEIKNLIRCIKYGAREEIRPAIRQIVYAENAGKNLSGINMKMNYIETITSLLRELSDLKEVSEKIWNHGFDFYSQMNRWDTPELMEEKLLSFALEVKEEMEAVQTNSSIQVIEKVKEYVQSHYMDPELSLTAAADDAGVSTGYLSGLFKKEAGMNFVKYLTDLRMEKSMELLKSTDKRTYEIAYETGFSNPHYFSVLFKKCTGMSPSDFRQRSRQ